MMASWHLSLFFSGTLFITLAVCVHFLPYFPSFNTSSPLLPLNKDSIFPNPSPCIPLLHEIVYNLDFNNATNPSNLINFDGYYWKWNDSRIMVSECGFLRFGKLDAFKVFNGSWIVVAGDSQTRAFFISLLSLVLEAKEMELARDDLFKRDSDYEIVVSEIGLRLNFVWAPFVTKLNDLMIGFKKNQTTPDVLVMGAGLWDMLHISTSLDYGISLGVLRESLVSFDLPHLFWLGMPTLVNKMLNTEEKREKLSSALFDTYDQEVFASKILRQNGGPLLLLDIRSLTEKCGVECTADGMHYSEFVYDSLVHIMMNALLIESHLKL